MKLTRLDRLARVGYFARAVVYGLLGYAALFAPAKAGRGAEGAFELVRDMPASKAILCAMVAGLIAYGAYKLAAACLDIDRKGHKPKGALERIGAILGSLAYLSMAWAAYQLAMGEAKGGEGQGKETARTLLDLPLGGLALGLAGAGFLVAAGFQLRSAWTKRFMDAMEPDAPDFTCTLGRLGLAARSVVFAVIGWSLIRSGWFHDKTEVRDLGGALLDLRDFDLAYTVIAVGLLLFAVFSAIEARYRIVPDLDVIDAGRRKVERKASGVKA